MSMNRLAMLALAILITVPSFASAQGATRQEAAQMRINQKALRAFGDVNRLVQSQSYYRGRMLAVESEVRRLKRQGNQSNANARRLNDLSLEMDGFRNELVKIQNQVKHKCASLQQADERKQCLGIELAKANQPSEVAKAEAGLLTTIVNGNKCTMYKKSEIKDATSGKSNITYEWHCQPAGRDYNTDYTRNTVNVTVDGVSRSEVKLKRVLQPLAPKAPKASKPSVVVDPPAPIVVPTVAKETLPQYPVLPLVKSTRWDRVAGGGLIGMLGGAAIGAGTGKAGSTHKIDNVVVNQTSSTYLQNGAIGAGVGLIGGAIVTYVVEKFWN